MEATEREALRHWSQLPPERFNVWRDSVLARWDAPVAAVGPDDPSVRGVVWRGWDEFATQPSLERVMDAKSTTEVEVVAVIERRPKQRRMRWWHWRPWHR